MEYKELLEDEIKEYIIQLFNGQFNQNEQLIENKLSYLLFGIEKYNYDILYDDLKKQGPRKVCQYQFRKNDIVWICRSCQSDETCVLCNDCFQNSNHEGHEVYFYHSQAGGCCDCGDAGAWKPEGFCTKHGRTIPNPMINISPIIQKNGDILMKSIVSNIIKYCNYFVKSYQFTNIISSSNDNETLYYLLISKSDIITNPDLERSILEVETNLYRVQDIIKNIQDEGYKLIGPKTIDECIRNAELLINKGLFVGIVDQYHKFRTSAFLIVIRWLFRIAQTSDGMCRLITKAMSVEDIHQIMITDPYLTKDVVTQLHGLILTLMADQQFKIDSAAGYAISFREVSQIFSTGFGTSQNSLFGLSVQFLNRYFYVEPLITKYNLFQSLSQSSIN